MNLNRRIESLENKSTLEPGLIIIPLEKGKTKEQALKRYCDENGVTKEELDRQGSTVDFLRARETKEEWLERMSPRPVNV